MTKQSKMIVRTAEEGRMTNQSSAPYTKAYFPCRAKTYWEEHETYNPSAYMCQLQEQIQCITEFQQKAIRQKAVTH